MNAEIVAVGTELLLGQIPNTNAQRISSALAGIGIDVYFHSVVGDNLTRMHDTLTRALERSDAVIVTGGLGPTPDDVTRDAVAAVFGRRLIRDDELVGKIRSTFERLNRPMPEENLRQADLPEAAVPIEPEGTAPGFYIERDGSILFALPGVPWEMDAMLHKTVLPVLSERAGAGVTLSRQILLMGIGESHAHAKISDIVAAQTNPTIAFLAGGGEVRLRLTAKASDEASAVALIEPLERTLRARLGDHACDGYSSSVAEALGNALKERGLSVAAAESLTGGLIGVKLTGQPGASDFFKGSLVTYSVEAKEAVAGVPRALLDGPGPVSQAAAEALARGAAERLGADLGIAATGVAGPAEHDREAVGTIFVGAFQRGRSEVRKVRGYGDRDNIRSIAATAAIDLGRRVVLAGDP